MTKEVYFLAMPRHRIFILAYDGCQLLDVTGPAAVWEAEKSGVYDRALLDADAVSNPVTVEVTCPYENRRRRATADIYVEIQGRSLLLEVKRDLKNIKSTDRLFFQLLEYVFWRAGVEYRVWTDEEIREEPAFSNAVWLARYKTIHLNHADKLALLRFFENRDRAILSEVSQWLGDQQQIRSFAMLMKNWLIAEPGVSVREDPVVHINPAFVGA